MLKCFYCGAQTVEVYEETISGAHLGFRAHCNLCGAQGQLHVTQEAVEFEHLQLLEVIDLRGKECCCGKVKN